VAEPIKGKENTVLADNQNVIVSVLKGLSFKKHIHVLRVEIQRFIQGFLFF
jgi:hypothetical protein